jgi:hypothetical protein
MHAPPDKQRGPAGNRTPQNNDWLAGAIKDRNSRSLPAPQEPARIPELWVSIGRETLGRIYQTKAGFGSFNDAGDWLGNFPSLSSARSAVWEAHLQQNVAADNVRRAA